MSLPQSLVQQRVYTLLTGSAAVNALVSNRVYDVVPDNPTYPFIIIGDDEYRDFSTHTDLGFEGFIQVDTWSQSHGKKECKEIQNAIYDVLNNIDLSLTGFKTLSLRCNLSNTDKDPDGRTIHGVQRFDFLIGKE